MADHSKDAAKPAFGKAAPRKVTSAAAKTANPATAKANAAAKPKKAAASPSIATKVIRKVKATAKGAASLAAAVVSRSEPKTGAKTK